MYLLECSNGKFYTGSTINLEERIEKHNFGLGAHFTSKLLPVKLVYFEEFMSIANAFQREKQVQRWSHKKKAALINKDFSSLHKLSSCRNNSHSKNNKV